MSSIVKGIVGAAAIVVGAFTGQAWLIGIGVSLEIGALSPKPKETPIGGSADQVSYDPTESRKLAVGFAWTMGSFVDEFSHDFLPWGGGNQGKNRVTEFVRALYDYECDSLFQVWNGTSLLTLGTEDAALGYPVQEYISNGKCHLYIKFHRGTWDQSADAHLIAVSGGRYSSTDQGVGVCYARITMVSALDSNDQVWAGGEPQLKFVVKGARLYNPAKDTSVGGSGSHRWDDPTTYEWDDNEPLIRYNVIRGFFLGNGKKFYGVGASHEEARFDDAVAAIACANEDVALKAGGTQKRYRAGGTIEVSVAPRDTIKSLAEASAGRTVTVAGQYRIFVGAFNAPVLPFSDADCLPQADYEDEPKRPGDSLVNAIYGSYTEPSEGFVVKSLPVRRSSSDIEEDGAIGERAQTLQPGFIQDFYQGQRVQEILRRKARRQITATRTLRPIYYEAEPGDGLAWSSDRLGYSSKSFYLNNQTIDQKINVTVYLEEDDAVIYEWDADTDELPIEGGDLPSADPPADLVPSVTGISPLTLTGDTGRQAPSLQIEFDDPQDPSATGFQVEYRLFGTTNSQFATVSNVVGGLLTLPHLVPDSEYEYRYRFLTVPGRSSPWSSWFTFFSHDVKLGTADIADSAITAIKFAAGITPVQVVDALADADAAEGATAVLTTTGELYRYHSGVWTKAVDAVDITNQLADAQIAALAASKITGTIINSQIAAGAITASNFASSIVAVEPLATLPVSGNFEGRMVYSTTDGQLYRYHSGAFTVSVPAANVGAGLTATQISSVAAATITGTLVTSQIGSGQITAGLIASATITATQLAAGSVGATQIAAAAVTAAKTSLAAIDSGTGNLTAGSVTASNIVAGTITGTQIASGAIVAANISAGAIGTTALAAGAVTASKITAGTITSTEIASGTIVAGNIASATITGSLIAGGTITATQLAANTITAGQIAAAAIGATQLAAGAITASKMFIGSTDNLVLDGAVSDLSYWTFINITGATIVPGNGVSQTTNVIDFYTPAGNACYFRSSKVSCIPGDSFYFSAEVYQGTAGTVELDVEYYDAHGIGSGAASIASTTFVGVAILSGVVVVPSGVVYISIRPYWYASAAARRSEFSAPIIRRMYTGSLIVNGTITAANIAAATITAANIAGNTITASQIASGTITAAQIAASTITASKIAAATITSSELASNSVTAGKIAAGAINATAIIATNIIVTGHIQSNQITTPVVASAGNVTLGTSGWTTIATASITTNGGVVQCDFSSFASWTGGTAPQVTYRVLRDGATQVALMTAGGGSAVPLNLNMSGSSWLDSPGAGSHSYALQGSTVSAAAVANANSIRIVELQR